ncbi:MAG: ATP-binding protein [Balneolaceae bacterium]|nr:ATP-binding protein [Balneolaceae bacterium]
MENARHLAEELEWFAKLLDTRFRLHFGQETEYNDLFEIDPPILNGNKSNYSRFVREKDLNREERITLLLSLIPHIRPHLLDLFFTKNAHFDRGFTEFGGLRGNAYSGFLPTGETVMFLLAGVDLEKRFAFKYLFDRDHLFSRGKILSLQRTTSNEPALSGLLQLNDDYVDHFTSGKINKPAFSMDFPAKRVTTQLEWEDLVLPHETRDQIDEVRAWLKHGKTLMQNWELRKRILPGFRALFHGPPGTGKTLTATLLGKISGRDVYRVDLSLIVSKYIGETEKNLARIFDRADDKDWILFFDEADALFGKRTEISSAHDRFANQEVSYLLQRMEDFSGMVILATNMKSNLDDAFTRRFQSVIYFPVPRKKERLQLWQNAFPEQAQLAEEIDLKELAEQYELTGAAIMNVIRYCSLMALDEGCHIITKQRIQEGIRKEFQKEGRTLQS